MVGLLVALYVIGYCFTVPKVFRYIWHDWRSQADPPMLVMVMALIFSMFWPVLAVAAVLTRVVRKDVPS